MAIHAVENNPAKADTISNPIKGSGRRVEFDYLRSFAVTLVLFHHAILAYSTFAFINFKNPIATFSPVVNEQRWRIFDLIVGFNDSFFMPLLFFVSGMFIWQSLTRKGAGKYLGGRLIRLGIPFIVCLPFLIPLAYYPAQLEVGLITGTHSNFGTFWLKMIKSYFGTAGPLWFLWLLLSFDCLVTLFYRITPIRNIIKGKTTINFERPLAFFAILLGISAAAYLPMVLIFGPHRWIGIGPFIVQASRILLYLVYFFAGTIAGSRGFDASAIKSDGPLANRWWVWLTTGLGSYTVLVIMNIFAINWPIVSSLLLVGCCGTTVFGLIGFFLRFARRRIGILDNLSKNSYGIYIIHYVFVTWLQYLLLENSLAPAVKGVMVFTGTLVLSWGTIAALRRIPAIAKII
ncbi:MAG: acyltransferase [Desulfobacteraceae bacterium]|nr:acyltransferase [Desulfobacteraceae bacterium]